MKLNGFEVSNFRNLINVSLNFSSSVNVFYGKNGSGKTSILEAIHYLGIGRSFRTRNVRRLINEEADNFRLVGQLSETNRINITVGIERKVDQAIIKIGGQPASSLIELANLLPLQLINADSHLLLTSGPLARRHFIDWGVFHVEPQFYHYWQRATKIVRQRNANLKIARTYNDLKFWDDELENCSNKIHQFREHYFLQFEPVCLRILEELLERNDFILHYSPGWNTDHSLTSTLENSFPRDRQNGYTYYGPHRCDLQLRIKNVTAIDVLSQGQQKLAAYALRIAQGLLLSHNTHKNCVFLIDDLPSELDLEKRERVMHLLMTLNSQIFVTGIEAENLNTLITKTACCFHVERGKIINV